MTVHNVPGDLLGPPAHTYASRTVTVEGDRVCGRCGRRESDPADCIDRMGSLVIGDRFLDEDSDTVVYVVGFNLAFDSETAHVSIGPRYVIPSSNPCWRVDCFESQIGKRWTRLHPRASR